VERFAGLVSVHVRDARDKAPLESSLSLKRHVFVVRSRKSTVNVLHGLLDFEHCLQPLFLFDLLLGKHNRLVGVLHLGLGRRLFTRRLRLLGHGKV